MVTIVGSADTTQADGQAQKSESSWSFGRYFSILGRAALEVGKTVGSLGLLFFTRAQAQFLPNALVCRNDVCYQPAALLTRRFNPGIVDYMNVGYQLVQNGTHACSITKEPVKPSRCMTLTAQMLTLHKGFVKQFVADADTPLGEEGTQVFFGNHRLFLNPLRFARYKEASDYLENVVLNHPSPFQDGVEATLEVIKKTHYFLSHDLPTEEFYRPGKFREIWVAIPRIHPEPLTKEDQKIFRTIRFNNSNPVISEKQLRTIRKTQHVPPYGKELERDLQSLAEKLATLSPSCKAIDYVAFGADVHTRIMKAQPFNRASGRLARLFLNTILKLGGHPEVVFHNPKDYYTKAWDGQEAFTRYLKEQIAWTAKYSATLY